MKQEVTRQGKGFTVAELRELAELLAAMQKLRWQLLKKLDRRAKAPWIRSTLQRRQRDALFRQATVRSRQ